MKAYVMEFIGAFFLVLAIGLTGNPLAIGLTLAAMVYLGGHISGAHYNPAVTLAVWLSGNLKKAKIIPYMLSQVLGSLVASYVIVYLGKELFPKPSVEFFPALLVEILFTFMFIAVILTVTSKRFKGNYIYGFAIGLALAVGALVGGPISGGVYNPAVMLGPAILRFVSGAGYPSLLIGLYILGPVLGAILAARIIGYLNK